MSKPSVCYEFGPFLLNVDERFLFKNREVVPLRPKVIDTLVVLVENSGHVVSKEGLIQSLWPDTFVEESSLTQNISLLRRALSENANGQRYIETIPKRGYRFLAHVQEAAVAPGELVIPETSSTEVLIEEHLLHDSQEPVSARESAVIAAKGTRRKIGKSYLVMVTVSVLLLSAALYWFHKNRVAEKEEFVPKTIAVLPFTTIGSEAENELMGLGMADVVILKLARFNRSRVLPTSSIFKYTKRDKDVNEIGHDLGVDAVLDGTIQRDGDRVRVTLRLIRLNDGATVWSEKFDRPYSGVFALQDFVSEAVASGLLPHQQAMRIDQNTNNSTENEQTYMR